jgi:putative acetyltransferase
MDDSEPASLKRHHLTTTRKFQWRTIPKRVVFQADLNSGNLWPTMNVRPYKPEDTAVLARLFTKTVHSVNAADYSPEQVAAWAPDPPDLENWRGRLSDRICFVAELDCEIVGFAAFEPDGHLDHMYVHRRFQRQGVASVLYQRIEQEALSRGVNRVFTEASITARPFFERVGFRVIASQNVERRGISFLNYRMERFLS